MSRHITLAVPAHSGTVHLLTLRSLLHDVVALVGRGDLFSLIEDHGNAQIADARAEICAKFLSYEDSTDLVFIDHDVHWESGALLRLLDYPVDVVAGIYPQRKDPISYPVMWTDAEELWADPQTGLLEAAAVPTGFLRITRKCLLAMTERYSELEFESRRIPSGKAVGLFEPYRIGKKKFSEDYSFCMRWRDMGGKVWVDPEIGMGHVGNKSFTGCLATRLREASGLTWKHCLGQIVRGDATRNTYRELAEVWGNTLYSACPDMLMECVRLAREADGPILELGSGLTTILMRAVTDQPITVYEESPDWAAKVCKVLEDNRLGDVDYQTAPLRDGFYDMDGEADGYYALAICDGPCMEARHKSWVAMASALRPGGKFIVDDLNFPGEAKAFDAWAAAVGADYEIKESKNAARQFAIGEIHA